jgi:hypothetical protein
LLSVADAGLNADSANGREWRLQSAPVGSRQVLAVQKVEGSSPFIRFTEPAGNGGFLVATMAAGSVKMGTGQHLGQQFLERTL